MDDYYLPRTYKYIRIRNPIVPSLEANHPIRLAGELLSMETCSRRFEDAVLYGNLWLSAAISLARRSNSDVINYVAV